MTSNEISQAEKPFSRMLLLEQIIVTDQVRKEFDDAELQSLAASIKADGLIQPIAVRPNGKEGHFELIAGERRLRAAKLAGLSEIRAEVHQVDASGAAVLQLVENVQRVDLNLGEQSDGVAALVVQLEGVNGKTGLQNATEKLGKSMAWVSRRAGVAAAPKEIKKLLVDGTITDVEIAAGLVELKQVAPEDEYEAILVNVREPDEYEPVTRDTIRDEVKHWKEEKKAEEARAAEKAKAKTAAAQAKKDGKPVTKPAKVDDPQAKTKVRWAQVGPVINNFAKAVSKATGLDVREQELNMYYLPDAPKSIEAHEFRFSVDCSGAKAKEITSKTGLTLKLDIHLDGVSADIASKIDQLLGKPQRWSLNYNSKLNGKQLAQAAAKAGAKIEIPSLDEKPAAPVKVEAKPAAKAAKPKAKTSGKKK